MGSYWDEVKGLLKKGANLAADEIKKDMKTAINTAKKKIDTAVEDMEKGTAKGKTKTGKETFDGKAKKEFESIYKNAMKKIDETMESILKGTEDMAKKARSEGDKIAGKAKEGAQFLKLRADLFIKQRELQDILSDLGDAVLVLYRDKKDIYASTKVKGLAAKAILAEKKCQDIEKKIAALK